MTGIEIIKTNCAIYQIVHKSSGKIYIGMTRSLEARKKSHFQGGRWNIEKRYSSKVRERFRGMSADRFHFGIIEYYPDNIAIKKLRKKERELINFIPFRLSLNFNGKRNWDGKKPKKSKYDK